MIRVFMLCFMLSFLLDPGSASSYETQKQETNAQKDAIVKVGHPKFNTYQLEIVNLCFWIVKNYSHNSKKPFNQKKITLLIAEFLGIILPDNCELVDPVHGLENKVEWARLSSDDKYLVTRTRKTDLKSESLTLWHVETGQSTILGNVRLPDSKRKMQFPKNAFVFTADNQQVIFGGCIVDTVEIWSLRTQARVHIMQGHKDRVSTISLSANDKLILVTDDSGYAYVWNRETGKCVRTFWQGYWEIFRVRMDWCVFCNNDQNIVSLDTNAAYIWSVSYMSYPWCRKQKHNTNDFALFAKISRDQQHLVFPASSSVRHTIYVLQLPTTKSRLAFREHTSRVKDFCFVRGDTYVASIDHNSIMYIWQLADGVTVHRFEGIRDYKIWFTDLRPQWFSRENVECIPFVLKSNEHEAGTICCLEVESGKEMRMEDEELLNAHGVSSDGRFMVVQERKHPYTELRYLK